MVDIKTVFESDFDAYRGIVEEEFLVDLSKAGLYPFRDFERKEYPYNPTGVPLLRLPIHASTWTHHILKAGLLKRGSPVIAIVGNNGIYYNEAATGSEADLKLVLLHEFAHLAEVASAQADDLHTFFDNRFCNNAIPYRRDEGLAELIARRLGKRLGLEHEMYDVYPEEVSALQSELQRRGIMSLRTTMDFVIDDRVGEETSCRAPGTLRHHLQYLSAIRQRKKKRVCDSR